MINSVNLIPPNYIDDICRELSIQPTDIDDIRALKDGMTNHSFHFSAKNEEYIIRIPGEGTSQLINRLQEANVYSIISNQNFCEDIVYIDPHKGCKISKFYSNARTCNPLDISDVSRCMNRLREFHQSSLKVSHDFDIWNQILYYEKLRNAPSMFDDYESTKDSIMSLKSFIEKHIDNWTLSHIDAVPDNFLIIDQDIRIIDWEYAGMQDPHIDIAMFAIYSDYDRQQIDKLIDIYFDNNCDSSTRTKIYCYVAACGFLWSNWCEYKHSLGVSFGSYHLSQYNYARDYSKLALSLIK